MFLTVQIDNDSGFFVTVCCAGTWPGKCAIY